MLTTPLVLVITIKLLISAGELMVYLETHVTENKRILTLTTKYYKLQLWNTVLGATACLLAELFKPNIYQKDVNMDVGMSITNMLSQMILGPLLDSYPVAHLLSKVILR